MGKIGVLLPGPVTDAGEFLADIRALEEAGVDSIWVGLIPAGLEAALLLAAAAGVTGRVRLGLLAQVKGQVEGNAGQLRTLNWLARGRALVGLERGNEVEVAAMSGGGTENWVRAPSADAASLAAAREGGVPVLVPMAPGLLDLLRRPDQIEDRSDLILSQG